MKNIKIYIALILASFFMSCSDFLDLQPVSEIGENNYFKTTGELETFLIGCYNSLQEPIAYEYLLTEFRSDNTLYNPNFSSGREATMFALDVFNLTSENEYVDYYYTACYSSIGDVNTLLGNTDIVEDADEKGHIEGQAKFIRAYQYFNLVRLYGPVFLVTEKITSSEANDMIRFPEDSIYAQIIEDLTFAQNNILDSVYTDVDAGRITTWAAKTLLAKVYLTMHDYVQAKSILEDIISNSGVGHNHRLLASYADVFDEDNEMNDEVIFAIRFQSDAGDLGNPLSTAFAPIGITDVVVTGSGDGYNYPATELLETYSSADTRKAVSVYDPDDATTHGGISEEITANFIKKFIATQSTADDSDADFIVLRYADVILMYAEALNETEGYASALPYLNEIRTRAGLSNANPTTDYEFRIALELERRLEFAFENHRWFDLVRTNRVNAVMSAQFIVAEEYGLIAGDVFLPDEVYDWELLLPIPQSQIDINPAFSQNYGY
jgi:hypothetical protein